jgi:hypothetical protein
MTIIAGYSPTEAADRDAAVAAFQPMARSPILRRSRFAKSTSISFEPSGPKVRSEPQLHRAARLHKT